MMITTELPILNVSRYIYFAKHQRASDEIWVSYSSDETDIHYSAVYKKSKNNYWNITELTSREYIDEEEDDE